MKGRMEFSFGVIPLKLGPDGLVRVLMVRHRKGHWGFPKGHAEPGESSLQTAERELSEETGLHVTSWYEGISFQESYSFQRDGVKVIKEVVYFPAYVEGTLRLQEAELSQGVWLLPHELDSRATFSEMKRLCLLISKKI